jgi:hypothetical protein
MIRDRGTTNQPWARDEWNIGVVAQTIEDITLRGIQEPVHWLKPDPWRILADPFCYRQQNNDFIVLAEKLNHWVGRGEIWVAILPDDGKLQTSDFKPFAKAAVHLSYPSQIHDGENYFLILESWESGGLHIWRKKDNRFMHFRQLLDGPVVDPTFFWDGSLWWLLCTFNDGTENNHLYAFYSHAITDNWRPHRLNPIKVGLRGTRPGGQMFAVNDMTIRPAQDCSRTYGGGLVLNQLLTLTPDRFEEITLRHIAPQSSYYCDGIHTISGAGQFTLIDGKRWHSGIANFPRKVIVKGCRTQRLLGRYLRSFPFVSCWQSNRNETQGQSRCLQLQQYRTSS